MCRYERVIPFAFRHEFSSQCPGTWTCFTYAIRFQNFKPGTDPIQQSASDFLLLSPLVLDEEASTLSVDLHLPADASVEARISSCGTLILNKDKVELVKKFNIWLFHLALGKCFSLPTVAGEGLKNYYILPCQPFRNAFDKSPEELIDWHAVETAVGSSLLYRRKVHYFGGYSVKLETGDLGSDHPPGDDGRLRMRNGIFEENDLQDAVVTCANNGLPCYIAGIMHDLNGSSTMNSQSAGPPPITYSEFYVRKMFDSSTYIGLDFLGWCPDQPLLKGYRLVRAGNYVRRSSMKHPNGNWETLELPPEVCVLHVGLQGRLCRGAMRLPSVLHSLEMALVAAELRNHIGPPLSCFKVQEALTSGACEGNYSYETMELLGDSVLNFVGGVHMFINFPSEPSIKLHTRRHDLVSNKSLYSCGLACGLSGYIFAELLNTKTWVPPGPALEDLPQKSSVSMQGQIIGQKTLADVVEALVGVYFLHGGLDSALKAMRWLQVSMPFPSKVPESIYAGLCEGMRGRNTLCPLEIATLEKRIGYHFRTKFLLVSAFDYGNEIAFNDTGVPIGGFSFQRLEFLGDSVLDFLITRHLVQRYPHFDPERLNDLRQATVNSENYACVALRHGLHVYLQKMSPILRRNIKSYSILVDQEGPSPFGIPSQSSPRAVGDLMQTLAGAVLLDSNFDMEVVWKVVEPLLRPIATPETVTLHPRRQLETLCSKQGLEMNLQSFESEGTVEARVYVNEVLVASSRHHESTVARRLAAFKALRALSPKPSAFNLYQCISKFWIDGERGHSGKVSQLHDTNPKSLYNIVLACLQKIVPAGAWQGLSTLPHPIFWILKFFEKSGVLSAREIVNEMEPDVHTRMLYKGV